jgi:hypothetical protein
MLVHPLWSIRQRRWRSVLGSVVIEIAGTARARGIHLVARIATIPVEQAGR